MERKLTTRVGMPRRGRNLLATCTRRRSPHASARVLGHTPRVNERSAVDESLRALAHPIRRAILDMVWDRERLAGELAERFDVSGPTISGHLKSLREAKLVSVRREGTKRWYRAVPEAVAKVRSLLDRDIPPAAMEHASTMLREPGQPLVREAREVSASVDVALPIEDAYACWIEPEMMTWCGRDPYSEPVPGGAFGFRFELALFALDVRGVFVALHEPSLVLFDWDFSGVGVEPPAVKNRTWIHLSELQPELTRVHICHTTYDEALLPFITVAAVDMVTRLGALR